MLSKIIFVVISVCAFSSAQKNSFQKDVDVFNMNYNRNQRSARNHHLLRNFDIVPSEVCAKKKISLEINIFLC
jgi:hypothetical protein